MGIKTQDTPVNTQSCSETQDETQDVYQQTQEYYQETQEYYQQTLGYYQETQDLHQETRGYQNETQNERNENASEVQNGIAKFSKVKRMVIGVSLVLACNAIYLGNNYIVKLCDIRATELSSVSGFVQIFLFGFLRYKLRKSGESQSEQLNWKILVFLCMYGAFMSMMSILCLVAIPLLPVGDLVVLCFTGPAFTVFLAFVFLKQRLTLLKIFLSFTIIGGDILVVKPPFIFGEHHEKNSSKPVPDPDNSTESVHLFGMLDRPEVSYGGLGDHDTGYFVGVGLCLGTAVVGALARIINTNLVSRGVKNNTLMLSSGISNFLLSFTVIPLIPNRIISGEGLPTAAYYCLPISVTNSLVALYLMTLSMDYLRDPTLVVMLRSLEILYSLVSESVMNMRLPEIYSFLGSVVVLMCVCSMALHDVIYTKLIIIINRLRTKLKEVLEVCVRTKNIDVRVREETAGGVGDGPPAEEQGGEGGETQVLLNNGDEVQRIGTNQEQLKTAFKLPSSIVCR